MTMATSSSRCRSIAARVRPSTPRSTRCGSASVAMRSRVRPRSAATPGSRCRCCRTDEPVSAHRSSVHDDGAMDTKWCPSCGVEYQPGIETCVDCKVALVDEQPERSEAELAAEPPVETQGTGQLLEFDLTEWPQEWRASLQWMLDGRRVP